MFTFKRNGYLSYMQEINFQNKHEGGVNMKSRPKNFILAGVGVTSLLLLAKKENREKLQTFTHKMKSYLPTNEENQYDLKAGHPDPQDTRDNEMVSEGAMTSVNYYNNQQEEK